MSTSTRNFLNRLGKNTNVFWARPGTGCGLLQAGLHPDCRGSTWPRASIAKNADKIYKL